MALRSLVGTQRSMTDIQGQLLQNNQAEMQNRAARQALQDEQQLRQMAGQGMPLEQLATRLDSVNPRLAMDLRAKLAAQNKVLVDTAKAGADIQKTGWETQNEQLKATQAKLQGRASLLNSIADPKTLALAVEQGRLNGYLDPEEAAQLAQMDPASPEFQAFKQQGMQQVLSQADSINQQLKQLELERTQGTQAGQIAATNAGNRVTVETAQSKVDQAQADAAKAGSAARVALGTEQGQIAAGPNAETGLTAAQQREAEDRMYTPEYRNYLLSVPPEQRGEIPFDQKWLDQDANRRKPQTNVTVNNNPDGVLTPSEAQALGVPYGTTRREAYGRSPSTEGERVAATFADRMAESNKILEDLSKAAASSGQVFYGALPNVLKPEDTRRLDQAKRNFVNAILRKESGAAISPTEFQNAEQQYFPQPGDTPAVIQQKAQNRLTAIEGMRRSAGGAANGSPAPTAATPKAPKVGTVEDGYMFLGGDPADPKNWKKVK